mmetsp:Transcript_76172/g.204475  ORF Transcript_76172/g.204475 Transcript_76172/m.204475 type:complete len:252 (-) Transcript_76172:156-911(-)
MVPEAIPQASAPCISSNNSASVASSRSAVTGILHGRSASLFSLTAATSITSEAGTTPREVAPAPEAPSASPSPTAPPTRMPSPSPPAFVRAPPEPTGASPSSSTCARCAHGGHCARLCCQLEARKSRRDGWPRFDAPRAGKSGKAPPPQDRAASRTSAAMRRIMRDDALPAVWGRRMFALPSAFHLSPRRACLPSAIFPSVVNNGHAFHLPSLLFPMAVSPLLTAAALPRRGASAGGTRGLPKLVPRLRRR